MKKNDKEEKYERLMEILAKNKELGKTIESISRLLEDMLKPLLEPIRMIGEIMAPMFEKLSDPLFLEFLKENLEEKDNEKD